MTPDLDSFPLLDPRLLQPPKNAPWKHKTEIRLPHKEETENHEQGLASPLVGHPAAQPLLQSTCRGPGHKVGDSPKGLLVPWWKSLSL